MYHSLTVENFFSFRGRNTLSFLGGKAVRGDTRFHTTTTGATAVKALALFGANASGKTNFLKAFSFIHWFLLASWSQLNAESSIPFSPFRFTESNECPTKFEVVVESLEGTKYIYALAITESAVIHESLRVRRLVDKRVRALFTRNYETYTFSAKDKLSESLVPKNLRRRNASFIAAAKQTEYTGFDDFLSCIKCKANVSMIGRQDPPESNFKLLYENSEMRDNVTSILRECDTGIADLEINKIDTAENEAIKLIIAAHPKFTKQHVGSIASNAAADMEFYSVQAIHQVYGEKYRLPLEHESNGTRQIIRVLPHILSTLKTGGVLVYDELEHGIHPNLLPVLLELFYSDEQNPLGAQIIFSSHAHLLLNQLHKEQIAFTEKVENQESCIYRLSDVNGVRNDDNFLLKYISGTYGAVPEL